MNVWNRRAAALLLACALCTGYGAAAAAETPAAPPAYLDSGNLPQGAPSPNMALPPEYRPPGSDSVGETGDPMEITGNRPDYAGTILPLPLGTMPELPETVYCITAARDVTLDCPVQWDTSILENAGTGRLEIPGKLQLPAGYHFAQVPPNALAPDFLEPFLLFYYEEGMEREALQSVDLPFFRSEQAASVYRLGVGNSPQALPFWEMKAEGVTQQGDTVYLPLRWETADLDVGRPGRYTLPGQIVLPPAFSLPEGFAPVSVEIEVGDPQPVLLKNPRLEGENVVCTFPAPISDCEAIFAEYRQTQTSWWNCAAGLEPDGKMHGTHVVYDGASLTAQTDGMQVGMDYSFRLRYQGVYSNVLHVRLPVGGGKPEFSVEAETSAEPPPPKPFEDPNSGDHGGGDRSEQKLPPLHQQAPARDHSEPVLSNRPAKPDAPSPSAAQPALPQEQSTETGVSLAGTRLERLAKPQDTVLFEKQGVAAALPSAFLRSLKLADGALLKVTVEPVGENGFRLAITADGQEVAELPPTLVRLPLTNIPDGGVLLACYDAQGNYICDAQWDPALGVATVEITRPGEYIVRAKIPEAPEAVPATARPHQPQPAAPEPPAPGPAEPSAPRLPPLALATLPAAGVCAWMLWRRRRGRSHE